MNNIQEYLTHISVFTYIAIFAAGVLASFTPCVYPLIPIVVGVIGSAKEKSKFKNFILSFSYVLGMAFTFAILGMIASLTGRLFGQLQSSPIAHIIVGNVMIFFGLALFGVVSLPTFFLSKMGAGKIRKGGSNIAAFLMGTASGFVAAPCTTAVLGAILAYVAAKQNVVFGFTFLFVFAIGLGTLLVLIGTFTGIAATLHKSEKVMHVMERVLAFGMIILGEYFIFKGGMLSF